MVLYMHDIGDQIGYLSAGRHPRNPYYGTPFNLGTQGNQGITPNHKAFETRKMVGEMIMND